MVNIIFMIIMVFFLAYIVYDSVPSKYHALEKRFKVYEAKDLNNSKMRVPITCNYLWPYWY